MASRAGEGRSRASAQRSGHQGKAGGMDRDTSGRRSAPETAAGPVEQGGPSGDAPFYGIGDPGALEALFALLSADREATLEDVLRETSSLLPENVVEVLDRRPDHSKPRWASSKASKHVLGNIYTHKLFSVMYSQCQSYHIW